MAMLIFRDPSKTLIFRVVRVFRGKNPIADFNP
jgi:hypothetical protein